MVKRIRIFNGRWDIDLNETNPLDRDSDNDGLEDGLERGHRFLDTDPETVTDPLKVDTDNDGIWDSVEDANGNGAVEANETDPASPDTDGDNIADLEEIGDNFAVPLDDDDDRLINALDPDSDNDGILDIHEAGDDDIMSVAVDTDNDGLPDYRDLDADGDTLSDTIEAGDLTQRHLLIRITTEFTFFRIQTPISIIYRTVTRQATQPRLPFPWIPIMMAYPII